MIETMGYLICVVCTVVYLLLGLGVRTLFQRSKHSAGNLWITLFVWPVPVILAALDTGYLNEE